MAFSWLQGKDPNQKNPYTSGTNVFDPFSAKHNEEVFRSNNPVNDLTQSNTAGRTGLTNQKVGLPAGQIAGTGQQRTIEQPQMTFDQNSIGMGDKYLPPIDMNMGVMPDVGAGTPSATSGVSAAALGKAATGGAGLYGGVPGTISPSGAKSYTADQNIYDGFDVFMQSDADQMIRDAGFDVFQRQDIMDSLRRNTPRTKTELYNMVHSQQVIGKPTPGTLLSQLPMDTMSSSQGFLGKPIAGVTPNLTEIAGSIDATPYEGLTPGIPDPFEDKRDVYVPPPGQQNYEAAKNRYGANTDAFRSWVEQQNIDLSMLDSTGLNTLFNEYDQSILPPPDDSFNAYEILLNNLPERNSHFLQWVAENRGGGLENFGSEQELLDAINEYKGIFTDTGGDGTGGDISTAGQFNLPPTQPGQPDFMNQAYGDLGNLQNEISDMVMQRAREPYELSQEQIQAQYEPYMSEMDRSWQQYQKNITEQANMAGGLGSGRFWQNLAEQGFGQEQQKQNFMQNLISGDIDRQLGEKRANIQDAMNLGASRMNDWLDITATKLGYSKFELARALEIDDQELQRIQLQADLENQQIYQQMGISDLMFGQNQAEINNILQALGMQQNQQMNVAGMGMNPQGGSNAANNVSYLFSQIPGMDMGKLAEIFKILGG